MIVDEDRTNPEITKKIESFLLDLVTEHPNEVYSAKDLESLVSSHLNSQYPGVQLTSHVPYAMNMLWSNQMVKLVGPNQWQSVDGPDPVYKERPGGYAPEGEFARRGKNFLSSMGTSDRKKFNQEVEKASISAKMLKNAGMDEKQVYDALAKGGSTQFHPVAIKMAIKKVFSLPGTQSDSGEDVDIDPSIFGVDFEK